MTSTDVLYMMMKGHLPAINIKHYLKVQRPKCTIHAKQFKEFVKKNIVEKSVRNNSQCFKPIPAKSEKFRNFFLVRTVYDWNTLSEAVVNCDSLEAFRTLISEKD